MKADQQKQAETLFFQTNLSKTEIAEAVGVSRRTVHYWVQQNHWDAIREGSRAMPTLLAGNCYLILARLQQSILCREDEPVTIQEVNAIYKLTTTITKLNKNGSFSENLEALTHFMDFVESYDAKVADDLQPVIAAYAGHSAVPKTQEYPQPARREDAFERQLDEEDLAAWAAVQEIASQSPLQSANDMRPVPNAAKPESPGVGNTEKPKTPPPAPHLNRAARRAMARSAAA
ncbi:MAG: hypothetical protein KF744_09555 [Taibaiella sp.]|nr:hypothetical protein [Taibaiella sp.]